MASQMATECHSGHSTQRAEAGEKLEASPYGKLGKTDTILGAAAARHRLAWIHAFLGNGRVARLMSHAVLFDALDSGGIWSVARGLARNVADHKKHLANADMERRNALDGARQSQRGGACGVRPLLPASVRPSGHLHEGTDAAGYPIRRLGPLADLFDDIGAAHGAWHSRDFLANRGLTTWQGPQYGVHIFEQDREIASGDVPSRIARTRPPAGPRRTAVHTCRTFRTPDRGSSGCGWWHRNANSLCESRH